MIIFILLLILIVFFSFLEVFHKLKPNSPLLLSPKNWSMDEMNKGIKIFGYLEIINPHKRMEVMIPYIELKATILGKKSYIIKNINVRFIPDIDKELIRNDNYLTSFIIKSNSKVNIKVEADIELDFFIDEQKYVDCVWIDINWQNYGPFGLLNREFSFAIPSEIDINNTDMDQHKWIELNGLKVLPIKTHLLGILDDPVDVVKNYCKKIIQPGDIITIAETPLAIMQGRYLSPTNINISLLARILCQYFHPTSSLATACGMQSLINIIGPSRALVSFIIGGLFKIIKLKGVFYILAGEQARLIDDITGTTPPYDKRIVLGPIKQNQICYELTKTLGIASAIVDVNDLGRIKVLNSSKNCDVSIIKKALKTNPAGNANQKTPLVLIRKSDNHSQKLK